MIDWFSLLGNALWIIALALALSVISFARWEAHHLQDKLREILNQPKYQVLLNIAGAIFCIGLTISSDKTWEQILWLILGILFGMQVWFVVKNQKRI